TGGFGIRADSIASYNPFCQWVIALFMILFGTNFNLFYLMLVRKFRAAFSSRELWLYLGIIAVAATGVTFSVASQFSYTQNAVDAIRYGVFQVASFITTTGYTTIPASGNINSWPVLAKCLLFLLMFVGSCAGSTGGGLKVSRVAILGCAIRKELRKVVHPRNANVVKFEGKPLSDEKLHSATSYFAVYMVILSATFLVLCFDGCSDLTIEANITAAVSCLNNIGPAYGVAASGYYMFSPVSKLALSLAMLLGRLEIYPLLLCLAPSTWTKK
ncbi:MAG: TrkH family potassium uptake protein, partial [Candidatus Fimimonas sp.]